jgi:hypothetical protein
MRLSGGGFYQIDGRVLRGVSDVAAGPGAENSWRDRQADLWAESSMLIHVHHRLSDEELGLWGAMQKELDQIGRTLGLLERNAMARANVRH